MKHILFFVLYLIPFIGFSQYDDIAPGWTKEKDRKLIIEKMNQLITRVTLETDCPKEQISYTVVDTYVLQEKWKKHELPKTIVVKACGDKLVFINIVINGSVPESWYSGNWTLNSVSEMKAK